MPHLRQQNFFFQQHARLFSLALFRFQQIRRLPACDASRVAKLELGVIDMRKLNWQHAKCCPFALKGILDPDQSTHTPYTVKPDSLNLEYATPNQGKRRIQAKIEYTIDNKSVVFRVFIPG
jgi:hypothetical protein